MGLLPIDKETEERTEKVEVRERVWYLVLEAVDDQS